MEDVNSKELGLTEAYAVRLDALSITPIAQKGFEPHPFCLYVKGIMQTTTCALQKVLTLHVANNGIQLPIPISFLKMQKPFPLFNSTMTGNHTLYMTALSLTSLTGNIQSQISGTFILANHRTICIQQHSYGNKMC